MAYIYKAKTKQKGSNYRCVWVKVTRPHGNSGVVRETFRTNLPPKSMGGRVRVFMYPIAYEVVVATCPTLENNEGKNTSDQPTGTNTRIAFIGGSTQGIEAQLGKQNLHRGTQFLHIIISVGGETVT